MRIIESCNRSLYNVVLELTHLYVGLTLSPTLFIPDVLHAKFKLESLEVRLQCCSKHYYKLCNFHVENTDGFYIISRQLNRNSQVYADLIRSKNTNKNEALGVQ